MYARCCINEEQDQVQMAKRWYSGQCFVELRKKIADKSAPGREQELEDAIDTVTGSHRRGESRFGAARKSTQNCVVFMPGYVATLNI